MLENFALLLGMSILVKGGESINIRQRGMLQLDLVLLLLYSMRSQSQSKS